MLLLFKRKVAFTKFAIEKDNIIDATGQEEYWQYWIDQGICREITEDELKILIPPTKENNVSQSE